VGIRKAGSERKRELRGSRRGVTRQAILFLSSWKGTEAFRRSSEEEHFNRGTGHTQLGMKHSIQGRCKIEQKSEGSPGVSERGPLVEN